MNNHQLLAQRKLKSKSKSSLFSYIFLKVFVKLIPIFRPLLNLQFLFRKQLEENIQDVNIIEDQGDAGTLQDVTEPLRQPTTSSVSSTVVEPEAGPSCS